MPDFALIKKKISPYNKKIFVDGDKSISIRWALLASQAIGKSTASNLPNSEDINSTIDCLKRLGIKIIKKNNKGHSFFLGQLIGIRSSIDKLESSEINNIKSQNYLSNHSIEQCVNLLEGRFILLQINNGEKFEVSCDLFNQIDLYYQNFHLLIKWIFFLRDFLAP